MRYIVVCLLLFLASVGAALAQQPITSTSTAGAITVTNTFQAVLSAGTSSSIRHGCAIQNLGSNNMWVFFGTSGATTPASIKLTPNSIVRCDTGFLIIQDKIWITGTALDQFVVISQ